MRFPFRPDFPPDPAVLDDHKPLIRSLDRRGLIRGGLSLGALAMLTGCDVKRPEAVESALLAISRFNDGVQALLFDPNKLAPTYPASMILRPPKFNAYYEVVDVKPVNGATWRLEVSGLVADKRAWTLSDLQALPQTAMVIKHICVEGWSYIGGWTGVPLRLFLERVGAESPGEIHRLQDGGRLPEQYRHGISAASADFAGTQIRRRHPRRSVWISDASAHGGQARLQEPEMYHCRPR